MQLGRRAVRVKKTIFIFPTAQTKWLAAPPTPKPVFESQAQHQHITLAMVIVAGPRVSLCTSSRVRCGWPRHWWRGCAMFRVLL